MERPIYVLDIIPEVTYKEILYFHFMVKEQSLKSIFLWPTVYEYFSGSAGNGINLILIPKNFLKIDL